ncbi:MAG: DUF4153 domain-containing protein [Mariprofundales bacterium]
MKASYAAIIGFCQGLCLLGLHEAIERKFAIVSEPIFWMPTYALVILLPIITMMTINHGEFHRRCKLLLAMAAVLLITACYTGYQLNFDKGHDWGAFAFTFASVMALASFVFLAFIQNWLAGKKLNNYEQLYQHAWYNALVVVIAIIFTGLVWMVLALWGALFAMLDIDIFQEIFGDRNFVYCATGAIVGYGVVLGQHRASAIIVERIDFLFRFLLLLVSFITILFVITLPLSGLQPLWDTRFATDLLMTLQLVFIAFFNGIYQHGYGNKQRLEAAWVRKLIETSALLMPLLSAISIYALWLRVDQYGWSFKRVIVALILTLLAIYAVGYAVAVLRKGIRWMQWVETSNVTAAAMLIIFAVLVHTPILDPKIIASSSLSTRIITENITKSSDYDYLRFSLGKPGIEALEELSAVNNIAIAEQAKTALAKKYRYSWEGKSIIKTLSDVKEVSAYFRILPADTILSDNLQQYIFHKRGDEQWRQCFKEYRPDGLCTLFFADFTDNGQLDFALIHGTAMYGSENSLHALQEPTYEQWQKIAANNNNNMYRAINLNDDSNKWHIRKHNLRDLVIDGKVYSFEIID